MNPEWLLHSSDSWSSQNSLFTNFSFITNYSSSTTWHCMIWIESLCAGIGWKLSLHISVLLINVILLFKAIFYLWITLNIGKLALSYVPWVCYIKICARVCHYISDIITPPPLVLCVEFPRTIWPWDKNFDPETIIKTRF